ncbi:MAG: methyltransferase domain-containing protein [Acidobacteriia bacterium]|nr:methyltransferase domain-containing protein [Terriglobia bacterium]
MADSGNFTCNICGAGCERPAAPPGREVPGCPACGSTTRLRSLIALLSREIFGVELPLPDFPVLKGVRGLGMSDPKGLAARLAEKFDYTNTFYHEEPRLDIVEPTPEHSGRYDFILSSEVLEHVPPPVERAFANLNRMLKPDGLLLFTVPYTIDGRTVEHFPELHEYALAAPGGRTVLVNRRRDGSIEVFENLSFHGGDGSTLEMRVFTETSLKETLAAAGFAGVHIASEDSPEFGVSHGESWSLPMVGRKGGFRSPSAEIAAAYGSAVRKSVSLARELEFHQRAHQDAERALAERLEWVHKVEAQLEERTQWARKLETELEARTGWARKTEAALEERTQWALALKKEKEAALAAFERGAAEAKNARQHIQALEKDLAEARAARAQLESSLWTRAGRKLGAI